MAKKRAVAFTGHRPKALGGYGKTHPTRQWIRQELYKAVQSSLDKGVEWFISGGAVGVDQWAAEIVLELGGKLCLAEPMPEFWSKWPEKVVEEYMELRERADKVVVVSDGEYSPEKMQIRNQWMVDKSCGLIAVWNGMVGGAKNTVRYAAEKGKPVYWIKPVVSNFVEEVENGEVKKVIFNRKLEVEINL